MEDESSHKKHEKQKKDEKHAKHEHEHKSKKTNPVTKWKIISGVLLALLILVIIYNNMGSSPVVADDDATGSNPASADTSNDPKIELLIINDENCALCDTTEIVQAVKENLFPTVVAKEIDFSSSAGQKYVENYDIKAVPAYIFSSKVAEAANFPMIEKAMIKVDGKYMIDPATLGSGKLLDPPSTDDDAIKGQEDAPVTIVEFSDFECPFCGKFYKETLPQIREQYVETGKVKMVFRDFPLGFHQDAQKAAEAAECAGDQGKFWEMHDKLYENQDALAVDDLKGYAEDLGLDTTEFDDCLNSGKNEQEVKDDMEAGQEYGVTGTPAFFINGIMLTGAQPFEAFQAVIDSELGAKE